MAGETKGVTAREGIDIIRLSDAGEAYLPVARILFQAYAASLPFDLGFQGFEEEVASLPGGYAPPDGDLLLALSGNEAAGCVAFRKLDADTCEMKRLFVLPGFRGRGVGGRLVARVLTEARRRGYARMRLDTVTSMVEANRLYRRFGFREIPPYCHNPLDGAGFFEKTL